MDKFIASTALRTSSSLGGVKAQQDCQCNRDENFAGEIKNGYDSRRD
jgi:hypothetical protein